MGSGLISRIIGGLVGSLGLYLLSWCVAYTLYLVVFHGDIDYSYLVSYFRAAWIDNDAGEMPTGVKFISLLLFVPLCAIFLLKFLRRQAVRRH
jgi:hypothetical protein